MKFLRTSRAFSMIELMVAMAITTVLVTLLVTIANHTTTAWKHGEGSAETFSQARGAMSLIGRELQGAVIDLDLGYAIQIVDGEPNNFVLKFLARRAPEGNDVAAVEKIAYQLAWASRDLMPEVTNAYDAGHPIPVLIRTSNSKAPRNDDPNYGLGDVFDSKTNLASYWVHSWGVLTNPVQTGKEDPATGDITEVVADNVLGWKVNPIYWNATSSGTEIQGTVVMDDPNNGRFFDSIADTSPRYITSDLKYVKYADPTLKTEPAESSPRAIAIRLVVVPSSVVPRLMDFSEWSSLRTNEDLFELPKDLSSTPFNKTLKASMQFFDATYYLSSKTP